MFQIYPSLLQLTPPTAYYSDLLQPLLTPPLNPRLPLRPQVRHFMNAASRVLGTDVSVESKYISDATHQP